jgi:predicted metal-dependent enzyme (double-stranded beta helix superfamily)
MFDKDRFIEACRVAVSEGQAAVREVVAEAVADPAAILAELGEPSRAGIVPLHRSPDLTVMNFTWAPCMSLVPHNHKMFSVVGIYAGREDNVFWRRSGQSIEAAGARSLGTGDVATLGRDIIHSVLNPIGKMTCAFHVYGGDFFGTAEKRSQWDHETLEERPWDIEDVKGRFRDAEARFNAFAAR